ncbi:hypothetical protein DEO72_LG3g1026 [Vigna unguiculata]|uniref:Uncharacterized protein n=1 Tax=Vigna unguiculata TaxID=3917 RepID=A0A4D6LD39_VIGUN|nr:hypothetical protein DEO72_LG3g1025 [Vigna unguiculata]QCD86503.1 hypothetical protein DEO72_LG3g1026 [Vigna unguiculata]
MWGVRIKHRASSSATLIDVRDVNIPLGGSAIPFSRTHRNLNPIDHRLVAGPAVTVKGNADAAGVNRDASSPLRHDSIGLRSSAPKPPPRICDLYSLKLRLVAGDFLSSLLRFVPGCYGEYGCFAECCITATRE